MSCYIRTYIVWSLCVICGAMPFSCVTTVGVPSLGACEICPGISKNEIIELESVEIDTTNPCELTDLFLQFERQIAVDEAKPGNTKGFFLIKWCKKAKKWFKRRIYHMIKEIIDVKKYSNRDYCAYTIAKFKRKIDRYYDTGSIDKLLDSIKKQQPNTPEVEQFMSPFRKRVKHFYKHKHEHPPHPDHGRYDYMRRGSKYENVDLLEGIPIKAVFGGLELGCGVLVFALPLPGCQWLGGVMMGQGFALLVQAGIEEVEKMQPKKIIDLTGCTVDTCAH